VIPVVEIDPINIGGVTIKNVTGHNAKFVYENKIGKGSIIKIVRSGDVIPYILSVEKEGDEFEYIEKCPMCGSLLDISGVDIVCNSDDCPHQKYKKVAYFLRTLGAENITEITLERLYLDKIEECFEIDEYDIAGVDGFGFKSAEIFIDEIQKCLNTTPERLIAAFGIPNVSVKTAKLIIDFIKEKTNDPYEIMKLVFSDYVKSDNLVKIHGIGEKTAELFWNNIKKYKNLVDYLYECGLKFESGNKKYDGVKFALTGKGPFNRGDIVKIIESNGGSVGSVTKSTKYLVTSNPESNSGKMKKAIKYGINIINYDDLMKMVRS
jgi:DNA ligase (NAD+)